MHSWLVQCRFIHSLHMMLRTTTSLKSLRALEVSLVPQPRPLRNPLVRSQRLPFLLAILTKQAPQHHMTIRSRKIHYRMPHRFRLLTRRANDTVQTTVQPIVPNQLDKSIPKIDDCGARYRLDILPLPRLWVHNLEAAELVEEDRDGTEICVLAQCDYIGGDRWCVSYTGLVATCAVDFVEVLKCAGLETEMLS